MKQTAQKPLIQLTPRIAVDPTSRESIFTGVNALIQVGETRAAEALLEESEKLHSEGMLINVRLAMDVSGSTDSAGVIDQIQRGLPDMLSLTVGEIPWQVRAALICFGDLGMGDGITTFDSRPLDQLVAMRWPRESGGSPFHESHLEAVMLAVGINLLREGELRRGSERLSPLPEGGAELILVTDGEGPRTNRITIKKARKRLPANCHLTVVALSHGTWKDLLREGDRFVRLDGDLTGLLRPVQDAIGDAVVRQATKTVGLIAANIKNGVAGYLAAPIAP